MRHPENIQEYDAQVEALASFWDTYMTADGTDALVQALRALYVDPDKGGVDTVLLHAVSYSRTLLHPEGTWQKRQHHADRVRHLCGEVRQLTTELTETWQSMCIAKNGEAMTVLLPLRRSGISAPEVDLARFARSHTYTREEYARNSAQIVAASGASRVGNLEFRTVDAGEYFPTHSILPYTTFDIIKAWITRHEAKRAWRVLRKHVRRRCILFYWMGETTRALCAPGGKRRTEDVEAFENMETDPNNIELRPKRQRV